MRAACATAVAALTWGATGSAVSAAPPVRAPLVSAGFVGLQQGSEGGEVTSLQSSLIAAGIHVIGGADGVFGPATRKALVEFQTSRGFAATGEVDQATSDALAASGGSGGSNGTAYVGMKRGAEGATVEVVQRALTEFGVYLAGGADGVFGPATERGVRQFQGWNGLTVSGTVSEATAKRLGLNSSSTSTPAPSTPASSAPAANSGANPYIGLTVGARGPLVKEVQQALQRTGLVLRGGADGVFGPATSAALKALQRVNGLTESGVVNDREARIMGLGSGAAGTTPPAAATPPSAKSYVGLAVGARGTAVKELQEALQRTGLVLRGGADGVFGNATKSALIVFQSVNGLSETGVVTEGISRLLGLGGGGGAQGAANPSGGNVTLDRFPVQGACFFGDTWGAARSGGRSHEGVDIIADQGKLIYAVADGEISKLYWDQPGALSGNGLRVAQPNGTYFTYLHMFGFAPGIELGTKVKAGDVIGFVGTTGASATPHLHFEIHPNGGAAVNPYPYVKAIDGCSNTKKQYQSSFS